MDAPHPRTSPRRWIQAQYRNTEAVCTGPSPRARSRHGRRDDPVVLTGLIPACAEQTSSTCARPRTSTARPRVRGADGFHLTARLLVVGSSPRARSGRSQCSERSRGLRLIPACAERTPGLGLGLRSRTAHPRVRGADSRPRSGPALSAGSSPRARSGLPASVWACALGRLIPACAERTPGLGLGLRSRPAHPRVRGADAPNVPNDLEGYGSSPRARSGLPASVWACALGRLIPACAERTPGLGLGLRSRPAHPRVRGADVGERGVGCHEVRLIPACAERTLAGVVVSRSVRADRLLSRVGL